MTKEQSCIKGIYELLETIESNARKRNFSLLRVRSEAFGCDMFQDVPPLQELWTL